MIKKSFKMLKHIVFVDDNKSEFELSEKIFKVYLPEIELTWFSNGDDFLKFLKENVEQVSGSTVVLMDVNMPKKGAPEILQEMHENELIGRVPVIVMSVFECKENRFYNRYPKVSFAQKPCGLTEYGHFIDSLAKFTEPEEAGLVSSS